MSLNAIRENKIIAKISQITAFSSQKPEPNELSLYNKALNNSYIKLISAISNFSHEMINLYFGFIFMSYKTLTQK